MSSENDDANWRDIDDYIASKSKYVGSAEYEGNGKVLIFNSNRKDPHHKGKWGEDVQFIVKEPTSGIEREVNTTAISLIGGVKEKLRGKEGKDVKLLIKKKDNKYVVDYAN